MTTNGKRAELIIENLSAGVEDKTILKDLSLTVRAGETHALMGPNGSGKSTLSYVIMGKPGYEVTSGRILFNGENILDLEPEERARRGLFMAFQQPIEISGVSVQNFLRAAYNAVKGKDLSALEFRVLLLEKCKLLGVDPSFVERYVNEGFSGGERKRNEVLQLAVLEPSMAVLDETDTGLDIDALRAVAEAINRLRGPKMGVLLITHYQRMLNYVVPDFVHVIKGGRIVDSGGKELALKLEAEGYEAFPNGAAEKAAAVA